jgi:hypothetical protein
MFGLIQDHSLEKPSQPRDELQIAQSDMLGGPGGCRFASSR